MSYCRFGPHSDVYCYEGSHGFECCGCTLEGGAMTPAFSTPKALALHLLEHRREGHTVPQDAIDALVLEAANNFPALTLLIPAYCRDLAFSVRYRFNRCVCARWGRQPETDGKYAKQGYGHCRRCGPLQKIKESAE